MQGYDNLSCEDINARHQAAGPDSPVRSGGAGRQGERAPSPADDADCEQDEDDLRCGYGDCKSESMQCCNTPKAFLFWISACAFVQGFVVNGVHNVNTSSYERRFELTSGQVGLISSSYDIAAGIFVLPITYYGTFGHQPRMLALAALLLCAGSFMMALPHFITDPYQLGNTLTEVCDLSGNSTVCESGSGLSGYRYMLMFGNFLHGIGGTTLYTVGVVYIDTNVKTENFPLYQGVVQTLSALGPAVGYLVGGYFLDSYVDFDSVDTDSLLISQEDPRWVGAWWLGFVAAGTAMAFIAVGLYPYPKITPAGVQAMRTKTSQAHQDGSEEVCSRPDFFTSWRDIPVAVKILVCNPVLMMAALATVSEGMMVAGFLTFLPKLIQNQFGQTAGWAALVTGFASVPGTVVGNILGSLVTKCFKLKVRGMLRLNLMLCLICALVFITALLRCDAANMAGVILPYSDTTDEWSGAISLASDCNANCGCTAHEYEPVCGADGIQYFTACHAGCMGFNVTGDSRVYWGCSCVMSSPNVTSDTAVSGPCEIMCNSLTVYLFFVFVIIMLTMAIFVPATNIKLRCVPQKSRSFGLGMIAVLYRFFGSVPGPILFGNIFDNSCQVWQDDCGNQGSCWVYDNSGLAISFLALPIGLKLLSASFYGLALLFYKPPGEEKPVIVPGVVAHPVSDHPADSVDNTIL